MSYSQMQNNSENHYILDKEDIALADNNTHYLQINPRVSVHSQVHILLLVALTTLML